MKNVLAVVGPTASGKTSLSIALAKELGGEIISCDSMQIYRGMDIGTAKPTIKEREGILHHLMDMVEPSESFSCADYAMLAEAAVKDVAARGKVPIVCGGTGLYLDALLRGGMPKEATSDPVYRAEMELLAREKGNESVHALLRECDPESAEAIHPNNLKRVIRALEICHVSGRKKSELDRENSRLDGVFEPLAFCLTYPDRAILYERIERRVDAMIEAGLVDEVRGLLSSGRLPRGSTAAQAIGYKEIVSYLDGEKSLDEAIVTLKTATRRYAKRQITWFGSKPYVTPIEVSGILSEESFKKIVKNVKKAFQSS